MRFRSTLPLLFLWAVPASGFAQGSAPAVAKNSPTHPEAVALADEGDRGSVYRKFPTSERLYTNDRDPVGGTVCYEGCSGAFPPVLAPADAVPVGEWTIVNRRDGKRQWALKGKPVYTMFHDAPDKPAGDGLDGIWRLVPYTRAPANPPVAASN